MHKDMGKMDDTKVEKLFASFPTCKGMTKRKTFLALVDTGSSQILGGGQTMVMIGKIFINSK